jgi:hypothetical protein
MCWKTVQRSLRIGNCRLNKINECNKQCGSRIIPSPCIYHCSWFCSWWWSADCLKCLAIDGSLGRPWRPRRPIGAVCIKIKTVSLRRQGFMIQFKAAIKINFCGSNRAENTNNSSGSAKASPRFNSADLYFACLNDMSGRDSSNGTAWSTNLFNFVRWRLVWVEIFGVPLTDSYVRLIAHPRRHGLPHPALKLATWQENGWLSVSKCVKAATSDWWHLIG